MIRLLVLAFLFTTTIPAASAAVFEVTTAADSGEGSLREAILLSNASFGPDRITLALPARSTIWLSTPLPTITSPLEIAAPDEGPIVLHGFDQDGNGIEARAAVTLTRLIVRGFGGAGIALLDHRGSWLFSVESSSNGVGMLVRGGGTHTVLSVTASHNRAEGVLVEDSDFNELGRTFSPIVPIIAPAGPIIVETNRAGGLVVRGDFNEIDAHAVGNGGTGVVVEGIGNLVQGAADANAGPNVVARGSSDLLWWLPSSNAAEVQLDDGGAAPAIAVTSTEVTSQETYVGLPFHVAAVRGTLHGLPDRTYRITFAPEPGCAPEPAEGFDAELVRTDASGRASFTLFYDNWVRAIEALAIRTAIQVLDPISGTPLDRFDSLPGARCIPIEPVGPHAPDVSIAFVEVPSKLHADVPFFVTVEVANHAPVPRANISVGLSWPRGSTPYGALALDAGEVRTVRLLARIDDGEGAMTLRAAATSGPTPDVTPEDNVADRVVELVPFGGEIVREVSIEVGRPDFRGRAEFVVENRGNVIASGVMVPHLQRSVCGVDDPEPDPWLTPCFIEAISPGETIRGVLWSPPRDGRSRPVSRSTRGARR